MSATIAIPVWLVIVAGLLAAFALLDRLLVPSWRWLLRNRANRVLEDVSARLRIQIRPFQQTSRQALIARRWMEPLFPILWDHWHKLGAAAAGHAGPALHAPTGSVVFPTRIFAEMLAES